MDRNLAKKIENMLNTIEQTLAFVESQPNLPREEHEAINSDMNTLALEVCKELNLQQIEIFPLDTWLAQAKVSFECEKNKSGFEIIPQNPNYSNTPESRKEILKANLDYPNEVEIETTTFCNAHCIFCPHDTLERRNSYMSDELFEKIVTQLQEIPKDFIYFISPFKVGELLMDPKIFQRIARINEALPNARVRIFSNFNSAKQSDIESICKIKNLHNINISLNSLDAEEYHKLMGLDLDKTLKNVFAFLDYVIMSNSIIMDTDAIEFSRVSVDAESDDKYKKTFAQVFQKYGKMVRACVYPCAEWVDYLPSRTPEYQRTACARWADVNICCDGRVSFCCMDGECKFSVGDVNKNTILEIYNSPMHRRLRTDNLVKNEVTPCRFCSQF